MGVFLRKSAFFYCSPLFPSFWAPFSVFSCPFGIFLFRFLLLFCFFSAVSAFRVSSCFRACSFACFLSSAFLTSYFLFLPFHPFSSRLYTTVHCFCLRCGRELRTIGKLRCRAGIDAVCKKKGAERVIPFLCPLRIFHQPGILLPAPRALGYHIYCQSSSLYFSQRLLQCHVPGSL